MHFTDVFSGPPAPAGDEALGLPGIAFSFNATPVPSGAGLFTAEQIVTSNVYNLNGVTYGGEFIPGLDNCLYYAFASTVSFVANGIYASTDGPFTITPEITWTGPGTWNYSQSFVTYYKYRPGPAGASNNIFITLGKVVWLGALRRFTILTHGVSPLSRHHQT